MQASQSLDTFINGMTSLVDMHGDNEKEILQQGRVLLAELIADDSWLADEYRQGSADAYRQYLLYLDPQSRFSVVSFVWGPGQKTPVHDHTVWGMVGVMNGRELCEEFSIDFETGDLLKTGEHLIDPGGIDLVSPTIGDVHRVSNALDDRDSISIHVYGADIGRTSRHIFEENGSVKTFISGYSND
ncbi:cysteine dioxygenase [Solemya velum gill symbiont]|uniref:Cysteine dioxygenase n=1 Tax=Solemya velum gill symbiont TaxID=2340 RepID=A0A0B0H9M5_SOVGS|nr:cysteine dioxygenase [Solemya velum gill symbiont]KHF25342.1 hypothetical protein JV46_06650 [Solemya velum gill symbiont]OOY35121.1 cysteine dioxygenase [Solemya velum gill symbiont]OOY37862.1 cysteine dioxygenase [Solemya velum gill symbiont]OOY39302.1 cysteine dioxygenase [Solemya velum gill symbiont]OOY45327.1 cysteine dioxygenase [Solemya velum gill symbiont]